MPVTMHVETHAAAAASASESEDESHGVQFVKPKVTLAVPTADSLSKKKPKKRSIRPSKMPRRALTAYNFFFQEERKVIRAERKRNGNPKEENVRGGRMARQVAERWKQIHPKELAKFQQLAAEDSIRYSREMEEYQQDVIAESSAQDLQEETRQAEKVAAMHPEDATSQDFSSRTARPSIPAVQQQQQQQLLPTDAAWQTLSLPGLTGGYGGVASLGVNVLQSPMAFNGMALGMAPNASWMLQASPQVFHNLQQQEQLYGLQQLSGLQFPVATGFSDALTNVILARNHLQDTATVQDLGNMAMLHNAGLLHNAPTLLELQLLQHHHQQQLQLEQQQQQQQQANGLTENDILAFVSSSLQRLKGMPR